MATNLSLALTSLDGTAFSIDANSVIYAYDDANSKAVLTYALSKGVNAPSVTLSISTVALQALSTDILFIKTVILDDQTTKDICFNNVNVIKLSDVSSGCDMEYYTNVGEVNKKFIIDDTASNVSTSAGTTIAINDGFTDAVYYINGYRVSNITSKAGVGIGTVLSSVVVAAPGAIQAPGDVLPLSGGTFVTPATVIVETTNLRSLDVDAAGSGYNVGDTITLAGGSYSTPVLLTVDTLTGGAGTGVATFIITNRGVYTSNTLTFTQASTSGSGTGATFDTASWGVNTVTIGDSGDYSVTPSNPVSQGTSSGSGINATFTATFSLGSVDGSSISYNDEKSPSPVGLSVTQTKSQVAALINAL